MFDYLEAWVRTLLPQDATHWIDVAGANIDEINVSTPLSFRWSMVRAAFVDGFDNLPPQDQSRVRVDDVLVAAHTVADLARVLPRPGKRSRGYGPQTLTPKEVAKAMTRGEGSTTTISTSVAQEFFSDGGAFVNTLRFFGTGPHPESEFWSGSVDPSVLFLLRKDPRVFAPIARTQALSLLQPIWDFRSLIIASLARKFASMAGREDLASDPVVMEWATFLMQLDLQKLNSVKAIATVIRFEDDANLMLTDMDLASHGSVRAFGHSPMVVRQVSSLIQEVLQLLLPHDPCIAATMALLANLVRCCYEEKHCLRVASSMDKAFFGLYDANQSELKALDYTGHLKTYSWFIGSPADGKLGRPADNMTAESISSVISEIKIFRLIKLRVFADAEPKKPTAKPTLAAACNAYQTNVGYRVGNAVYGWSQQGAPAVAVGGAPGGQGGGYSPFGWTEREVDGLKICNIPVTAWSAVREELVKIDQSYRTVCTSSLMLSGGCHRPACSYSATHGAPLSWSQRKAVWLAANVVPI